MRSSLHTRPRLFPWLILRCLPHPTATTHSIHALDPSSRTWLSIPRRRSAIGHGTAKQPSPTPNVLHGSAHDRLYALSLSRLVISKDPFGNSCPMEAKGPKVWRQDPVVAEVGRWVVVVGGGFLTDLEEGEEEGAVEVYDKQTGAWDLAEPMPTKFDGSTRQLRPEPSVSKWAIGAAGEKRLLLVGAGIEGGEGRDVMKARALHSLSVHFFFFGKWMESQNTNSGIFGRALHSLSIPKSIV